MKRILITVAPNGEATVETKGFVGNSCQAASQLLERALGKRTSESLTSEFHQAELHQSHHSNEET